MTNKHTLTLFFYFVFIVFSILLVTLFFATAAIVLLTKYDLLPQEFHLGGAPLILLMTVSICISLILSVFVWNKLLSPITDLSTAFKNVAKGDFSIRLPVDSNISEMREMSQSFNSMVSELAGIETLRNDFVVNVSHEFKTPLAAIEGYATLLQNKSLSEQKRSEYVGKIIDSTVRLSEMTGNILSLSKLENQEMVTDKKKYRLDEQLRKAVLMLENMWSCKDITFDIDMPKKYFFGNEGLLYQVWYNLIANAIKYTAAGGQIGISLMEEKDKIVVSISDNGCGMTDEVQKHIFEKFYQGDTTRKAEGNGLGLSLVKRIVELCEGSITVSSRLGEGSVFTVSLPDAL